ncbi:C-GCAxxG-C-C family (seleno)protein [Clostridium acetireducens]|uniref:C-GCAxxG-C-C family (seleno)protein n=1 Tax=Clostridium acetireducens TaxID=76489 RepID=UPI000872FA69
MDKASNFKKEGYNCCESIIKAVNEDRDVNIPISVGTPFGGGMSVGHTCGAITGAIIALGFLKGRNDLTEKNTASKYSSEIMKSVKEKYGTYNCRDLKKKGVSCEEIIDFAYDELKKIL